MNNELQNNLKRKKIISHYENSTEIVYELDENGIITLQNWKTILGHEVTDVVEHILIILFIRRCGQMHECC
jgi:hypothetical protein